MNVTEARHVDKVLTWVLELASFEHTGPDGRSTVTDPALIEAVTELTHRARGVMHAGRTRDQADASVRVLLGLAPGDPEAYRDDVNPDDTADHATGP